MLSLVLGYIPLKIKVDTKSPSWSLKSCGKDLKNKLSIYQNMKKKYRVLWEWNQGKQKSFPQGSDEKDKKGRISKIHSGSHGPCLKWHWKLLDKVFILESQRLSCISSYSRGQWYPCIFALCCERRKTQLKLVFKKEKFIASCNEIVVSGMTYSSVQIISLS